MQAMLFFFDRRKGATCLERPIRLAQSLLLLAIALTPTTVWGQISVPNQFSPISSLARGVHLYGISVFSGYYSAGVPYGSGLPITVSPGAEPSYDVSVGTVATFGFNRSGENSNFSATYSPSYFGSIRHSEYNTLNHSFSLNWNRKLTPKWSVGFSAAGMTANMEQLLFAPTTLDTVTAIPTTFDDLTSALLAGKYTNSQLASLLTGTQLTVSPDQTFLYGERILSGTLGASFSYAANGRSSFNFGIVWTRSQQLRQPLSDTSANSGQYLIPQTTSGSATLGWSFSLTPRTQIALSAMSTRLFSRFQQGYTTSTNFSVGHTMSRHWFLQARGGAGTLFYSRDVTAPAHVQYLAGGGIGFKTFAHTFIASYDRSLGDGYGLGSGSTGSATAAWNWKRPASGWSVFSSIAYQRLANLTFQNPTSWQAGVGVARALSSHIFMNAQYSYLQFPYLGSLGKRFSQNAVVLSMNWSPSEYR